MVKQVIAHQSAKDGSYSSQADRASGEIDPVWILGPRGIGLKTPILAEGPELFLREESP